MNRDSAYGDPRQRGLARALRRRMPLIVLCALAVPAVAIAISLVQDKKYTSTASLLFRDPQLDQKLFGSSSLGSQGDPAREAATNVILVSQDAIAQRAARALGGPITADEITKEVTVAPVGDSNLASVEATDRDPKLAARMANTYAEQYIAFRRGATGRRSGGPAARRASAQRAPRRGAETRPADGRSAALRAARGSSARCRRATPSSSSRHRSRRHRRRRSPVRNTAIGPRPRVLLGVGLALPVRALRQAAQGPKEVEAIFSAPSSGRSTTAGPRARTGTDGALRLRDERRRSNAARQPPVFQRRPPDPLGPDHLRPPSPARRRGLEPRRRRLARGRATLVIEADLRRPRISSVSALEPSCGLSSTSPATMTARCRCKRFPQRRAPANGSYGAPRADLDVLRRARSRRTRSTCSSPIG